MSSDIVMKCRCDKVVEIVKVGNVFTAECAGCGVKVQSSVNSKDVHRRWRNKFGCTASPVPKEEWHAKNRRNARKKAVVSGSVEEFAQRVAAETRKRMMLEKRSICTDTNGIPHFVHDVADEKLDKFSEIKISESENGLYWIVKIGPVKEFHVHMKTNVIYSKNRKEQYGTTEDTDGFDWSGFWPVPKDHIWKNRGVSSGTIASNSKRTIIK